MPPNPPSTAHGFAMSSMSLRDMQIPKSEKNNFCPPPFPNSGDAPDTCNAPTTVTFRIRMSTRPNSWHTANKLSCNVFNSYYFYLVSDRSRSYENNSTKRCTQSELGMCATNDNVVHPIILETNVSKSLLLI